MSELTRERLAELWERSTELPSDGPLHSAIINEALDCAPDPVAGMTGLIRDIENFREALRVELHPPLYNHALTIAYEVVSTSPDMPTLEEAMEGLIQRLAQVMSDRREAEEALLNERPFDTYKVGVD